MKKILLLSALWLSLFCNAQQKELDSLLNELKKHPQEDTASLHLLVDIIAAYNKINPDSGLLYGNKAISLAKKLGNQKLLGKAFTNTGINYMMKGEFNSALILFFQAVHIGEKIKNDTLVLKTINNIGIIYFRKSMVDSAFYFYTKSLLLAQKLKDQRTEASTYGNLGMWYRFQGDYDKAFENSFKSAAIFQKYNNETALANIWGEIGLNYRQIQDYDNALLYYDRALKIFEKSGDIAYKAVMLGAKAQVYQDKKDYSKAIAFYRQSIEASKASQHIINLIEIFGNIGIVYREMNDYNNALMYLQKANTLSEQYQQIDNISALAYEMAKLFNEAPADFLVSSGISAMQRFSTVKAYLEKSLEFGKKEKSLLRQHLALNELSLLHSQFKDFENAYKTHVLMAIIADSIFNDKTKTNITRSEMQYEFNKKEDSIKAVNDKKQALAAAEIQKQRIIKNSTMAGAGFLVLAGIAGFTFYKRNKDIRTQKNEAELKQQVTDVEMKALRAQMNPHFIFNSLNSIADYIEKNQNKTATEFTAKFAKLMRMVLENSEHKEIPLADDLKALELYMQLERFRLQNKFDYTIKVDESINAENTLVPPLILQPFIENSIWHGIAQKEGHGNITIYIKEEEEMISCIVEDDGGGIKEKEVSVKENKSLGMRITKERIDIMNKQKNSNASMNVLNTNTGVKAEVKLPLELSF